MKIAAIAKVIKDRGSCRLYRVHGSDDLETKLYIGTNSEIYSLEGFPKPWSEAEVMTMLGIEKKKEFVRPLTFFFILSLRLTKEKCQLSDR